MIDETPANADWIDPDTLPRRVVTYGFSTCDLRGFEIDRHQHRKGQMMLVEQGALSCETQGGLWIVPPASAIWIPGGTPHAIKVIGALKGYNAFIEPDAAARLPSLCSTLAMTPLLRELIVRAARLSALYEEHGTPARIIDLMLDELADAPVEDLHLPMPTDIRLRQMAERMIATPSDRATLKTWAVRIGMSERTLARSMKSQTGMSFGRWRQQLGIMRAIERLSSGAAIQQVAAELGYDSVPSFTAMFRQVLGAPPGRYMTERHRR